jgi:hypothetical protein
LDALPANRASRPGAFDDARPACTPRPRRRRHARRGPCRPLRFRVRVQVRRPGAPFIVCAVHLGNRSTRPRTRSTPRRSKNCLTRLRPGPPVVIGGDFDISDRSASYRALDGVLPRRDAGIVAQSTCDDRLSGRCCSSGATKSSSRGTCAHSPRRRSRSPAPITMDSKSNWVPALRDRDPRRSPFSTGSQNWIPEAPRTCPSSGQRHVAREPLPSPASPLRSPKISRRLWDRREIRAWTKTWRRARPWRNLRRRA